MPKTLTSCTPRQTVLDGTADFVVNLADLPRLTEAEARDFLESNVLTSGMELLLEQTFMRMCGDKSCSGIYKLSESMGGGKSQSLLVAGVLARFPHLANIAGFKRELPETKAEVVAAFTGRSTDQKVWIALGRQLGVEFAPDRAPSETEWRNALRDRPALILLDELAFYLVHAASQGSKDEGTRLATLTGLALTNLFGAVRDYKECGRCVLIVADLQKDWEQGAEELAKILRANSTLGGTINSVNNEMSKGAQSISPVDNQKDELYAILRKRLFKHIDVSEKEKNAVADAYIIELAKASAILERPTVKIREEILVSYPFHFSTKHLIASFNDNPGFQKTRDVIRLMAAIVRGLWAKGDAEVQRQSLLSLETADLNNPTVSSRFIEIKKSLQDALQIDIANNGTSHAESVDDDSAGLATRCAKWIYAASLCDVHPQGLTVEELAEYLLAPGQSIIGMPDALKKLYDNCWYIEQTKSGRYLFNRHKNLNAQVNSYVGSCTYADRDAEIEKKLAEMFEPKDKRCYQKLAVLPALDEVQLERDKTTLLLLKPDTNFVKFFGNEKFKNRVAILTADDQSGMFPVNKKAERLWAIKQVVKDLNAEDSQYKKANDTLAEYQTELFLALKAVFNKLHYPLVDDNDETALVPSPLLDSYINDKTGQRIQYRNEEASKGEFVIEATLRDVSKFQVFLPANGQDKLKTYQPLQTRIQQFLFPATGRATWQQIVDGAASKGQMLWTEPGTLERMREVLITAGKWREDAGQIQKPPFEEVTGVAIEYNRDKDSGRIETTDIKLSHADKMLVRQDNGEYKETPHDVAFVSDAMLIEFRAIDSSGKNKEGKPYRIENSIDIHHVLQTSTTPGHRLVKVQVIPPTAVLKFTCDDMNPANNGKPYVKPGIDVAEGATVRLFAEKGTVSVERSIPIPQPVSTETGPQLPPINPRTTATVNGKGFAQVGTTRSGTYKLLTSLPNDALLQKVQAKVTLAATDSSVTLTWDGKSKVTPAQVIAAFEFLDKQIEGGEWWLRFEQVHFSTGDSFVQWQISGSYNVEAGQVTQ